MRAKVAVKKEGGKPPTPKSAVSTSRASGAKKVEDHSKKRKLDVVEITEVKDAASKSDQVKARFGLLVKDFADKVYFLISNNLTILFKICILK